MFQIATLMTNDIKTKKLESIPTENENPSEKKLREREREDIENSSFQFR